MSVEVVIPPSLQNLVRGIKSINVEGQTLGECLNALVKRYPELKPSLFDKTRGLQKGFSFFINKENAYPEGLSMPIRDGDKLYITDILVGG